MEGVLRGAVQVKDALLDGCYAVEDRGSKGFVLLDAREEIFDCVNLRELILFGVSCPEQNNFVCFLFHMLNILPQFINNFLISTQKDVVCTVRLVGCDEIGIQSRGQGDNSLQLGLKLLDQVRLKDL